MPDKQASLFLMLLTVGVSTLTHGAVLAADRTAVLARALGAVVVLEAPPAAAEPGPTDAFLDQPFGEALEDFLQAKRLGQPAQIGTGLVLDAARGLVLTADFVVADADELTARLPSGEERAARVVARDDLVGVAVLEIAPGGLDALPWALRTPVVGETVYAVGNAYSLGPLATAGMVSAAPRKLLDDPTWGFATRALFVDADIHRGMGGGPLLDANGNVIGLVMAQYGGLSDALPLGVALLGEDLRGVVDVLAAGQVPVRGWIGVDVAEVFLASDRLEVIGMLPGSPADAAGLQPGDEIVAIDGAAVTRAEFQRRVAEAAPGQTLNVVVERTPDERPRRGRATPEPETLTFDVVVAQRPPAG